MKRIQTLLNFFLNEKFKDKSENVIIYISIIAFIGHLLFIFLNKIIYKGSKVYKKEYDLNRNRL